MSRALVGECPGCGAQVSFHAGDSVLAICQYCATTCVRAGNTLRNLGKMADLFDDHSPIRLQSTGQWNGQGFVVVGRLQYRYSQGMWNEWRVLFDDGSAAWLSDDNGSYVITIDQGAIAAPPFQKIELGSPFSFGKIQYTVTYREQATVIAGAGELPFIVGSGYDAPIVDLRGPDGEIANLDYSDLPGIDDDPASPGGPDNSLTDSTSDDGPRLYLGHAVTLASMKMQGIDESQIKQVVVEAFSCPQCGATVTPQFSSSKTITCASCASVLDLTQGTGEKIAFYKQHEPPKLLLPLGRKGRLNDIEWTVVGFQIREGQQDGDFFGWREFLLHNTKHGFRYLNLDGGNWTLGEIMPRSFKQQHDRFGRGFVRHKGQQFDQFSDYGAHTNYVMGEFFWQVKKQDDLALTDFIAPPLMLSREVAKGEITWSLSRHVSRSEIAEGFGVDVDDLPRPAAMGVTEPVEAVSKAPLWMLAAGSLGLLIVGQLSFSLLGNNNDFVRSKNLQMNPPVANTHLITIPQARANNLAIEFATNLSNDYAYVSVDLEPLDPKLQVRESRQEISYYSGYSGGESWSEGSQAPRVVFMDVTPGKYKLVVRGERDEAKKPLAVRYDVKRQGRPHWWPFWTGLGVLLLTSLFSLLSGPNPERTRWAESQYGSKPGRKVAPYDDDDD